MPDCIGEYLEELLNPPEEPIFDTMSDIDFAHEEMSYLGT